MSLSLTNDSGEQLRGKMEAARPAVSHVSRHLDLDMRRPSHTRPLAQIRWESPPYELAITQHPRIGLTSYLVSQSGTHYVPVNSVQQQIEFEGKSSFKVGSQGNLPACLYQPPRRSKRADATSRWGWIPLHTSMHFRPVNSISLRPLYVPDR